MTPLTDQQRQTIEATALKLFPIINNPPLQDVYYGERVNCIAGMRHVLTHLSEFLPEDEDVDAEITANAAEYCKRVNKVFDFAIAHMAYLTGAEESPYRAMYEAIRQERDSNALSFGEWLSLKCKTTVISEPGKRPVYFWDYYTPDGLVKMTTVELYKIFKSDINADKTAE